MSELWTSQHSRGKQRGGWLRPLAFFPLAFLVAAHGFAQVTPPGPPTVPQPVRAMVASRAALTNLEFDATMQVYKARLGDAEGTFTFKFTNVTDTAVHILDITPGCTCTKAHMPRTPWIILPHTSEELHATMSLANKPAGDNTKTLTISSTNGMKVLWVKAMIPTPPAQTNMADRTKNQELAKADRQAVFRNDCVQCHVTPAVGKLGKELYDKACGICHDSEHRASMITDLGSLNHPVDAEFWKLTINNGKPATMMPAFAQAQGGPLTKEQVDSLVTYLMTDFPGNHKPTPQIQLPEAAPHATRPIPMPPPRFNPPSRSQAASSPGPQPVPK